MELNNRNKLIILIALIGLGFGAGYFAKPSRVDIQYKDREVIKEVIKEVVKENKNIITIIKETKNKDGSSTIDTTIEDKSQIDSSKISDKEVVKEITSSKITTNEIGLTVQALAIVDLNNVSGNREYGIYVKKRVFSNVSVGAMATTDKKVGIAVGLDF
jgi:hypothetical protein